MIELFSLIIALLFYLIKITWPLNQKFIVAPLCLLIMLIGWKDLFKIYLKYGLLYSLKYLILNPSAMFLASASLLYSYSLMAVTFVPSDMFELAIIRPVLYEHYKLYVSIAAIWTTISVALISFLSKISLLKVRQAVKSSEIMYINVLFCFLVLNIVSISIRIYAFKQGWTNFLSDGGYSDIFGPLSSIASILSALGFFLPAVWLTLFFLTRSKFFITFTIISWFFECSYGMVYGQKAAILAPTIALIFSSVLFARRIPVVKIVLLMIFIIPVLGIAVGARAAAFKGIIAGDTGIIDFINLAFKYGFSGGDSYGTAGDLPFSSYLLSRFNIAIPFLGAIFYVDTHGPTYNYDSYLNILFALIPSSLLPIKPKPFNMNEFGYNIGLVNANDILTSVRPTYLGDLYYNFGFLGLMIGIICFGIFLNILSSYLRHIQSDFKIIFALFCAFVLFDIENSISNVVGGIIKTFILFYLIEFFSRKRKSNYAFISNIKKIS